MSEVCVKHREIVFCDVNRAACHAEQASQLLCDIEGIVVARPVTRICLHVSYDLRFVTLQMIEEALVEVGFHLDNSLLSKLKRALYGYAEETQRLNMGCAAEGASNTRDVFIDRYQRRPHGCRDTRPHVWRRYL